MQMSDHEILYHYNHAADQAAQVKILAELNAVDVPTMRNKLLDLGAKNVPGEKTHMPKRLGRRTFDENRAFALYEEGACDFDMAEALGVSRTTIADWRTQNGLKCHRAPPGYVKEKVEQKHEQEPTDPEPETIYPPPDELPPPPKEIPPEETAHMGVDGLLRVTRQLHAAFPQAEIVADGHRVQDVCVHIDYNAAGEVVRAEMELILED